MPVTRFGAARAAGWLGMNLATRGEIGPAGGWFGRAHRLVQSEQGERVEHGYLLLPTSFQHLAAGELEAAFAAAGEAAAVAQRFRDADLLALALQLQGLIRVEQGRLPEGLALLDEAMVGVTAGEVSPIVTGIVYCGVIACCEEAFDPRRAQQWTNALTRWWEEQPQLVAFTGRCLTHRAGIMQLHGAWRDALEAARFARERCEQAMNRAATGQALYQQGELHRLQGDAAAAEAAYREASRYGREPQPGLALLRLQQGNVDAAAAAIRRVVDEATQPMQRAGLLPAYAEIMLASGDVEEARAASRELAETAETSESPMLSAIAAQVGGAVDLAEDDARAALASLRHAAEFWQELDAPYEVGTRPGAPRPGVPGARRRRFRGFGTGRRARGLRAAGRRSGPRASGRVDRALRNCGHARTDARVSSRCSAWSRRGRRTGRSPRLSSSASTRSPATCRTSAASWASPRELPPPRSRSSTSSCKRSRGQK